MSILITVLHCLVGLFLIVVVLLQSGRAGGMGAGFGGSSTGVFGARGANTFLTKVTAGCAITFFLTSITLSVMSSKTGSVVADEAGKEAAKPKPVETGSMDATKPAEDKPAEGKPADAAPAAGDVAQPKTDAKAADAAKPADEAKK
jgi:preprotein translocase subunit SecG